MGRERKARRWERVGVWKWVRFERREVREGGSEACDEGFIDLGDERIWERRSPERG